MPSITKQKSPLIKGYLPIHLSLPSRSGKNCLFVKEHINRGKGSKKASSTLFVTNVPVVPGVLSRLFLLALFERFGDVEKVTVEHKPRKAVVPSNDNDHQSVQQIINDEFQNDDDAFGFAENNATTDEGKFAHVTFASSKALTKAMSVMTREIKKRGCSSSRPLVTFTELEVRRLESESKKVVKEECPRNDGSRGDDDDDNDNDTASESETPDANDDTGHERNDDDAHPRKKHDKILNLVTNARRRRRRASRRLLMDECNAVIQKFEAKEERERRAAQKASAEPDDDGFVTVSYGTNVGSKRELDETVGGIFGGSSSSSLKEDHRGSKRRRHKKESIGSAELKDFYRFQMRESKKNSLEELRQRFEQDLANVKKMKEENLYRPF
mmetsp:Transcript_14033/g.17679  ORF Transcript_14033/g.17679 Transcript_14033/m.17679 type:complete len:384 (-) Transcript_14033:94-1245(-)|eukprot:CAMPEP_0172504454 /NCGR_PEP_ID=MMETSP1066-20121228/178896_1 /TAXON_ID=671091 /ORGANISM="Coscinodiscus wailesii, Strain CCMP2513" /LENGTH=383 /DNA_ID=CAMNT_0013280645 /DNA_START=38 /DNA_END=1189 /DNA_ORIENTATION=+